MKHLNKFVDKVKTTVQNIQAPNQNTMNSQEEKDKIDSFDINKSESCKKVEPPQPKKPATTSMKDFLNSTKHEKKEQQSEQEPGEDKKIVPPDSEFLSDFTLIEGEVIKRWDKCKIKIDKEFECKYMITSYRLYAVPKFSTSKSLLAALDSAKYDNMFPDGYFSIPIHMIEKYEKSIDANSNVNIKFYVTIVAKDHRKLELIFDHIQGDNFYICLSNMMETKELPSFSDFAVNYNKEKKIKYQVNGWDVYKPDKEFARQGLKELKEDENSYSLFRHTKANEDFSLCQSYPKYLVCPGSISDHEIREAARFRTKNRIPTLSYYYYKNHATIWRSSQTKAGLTNKENDHDKELMHVIAKSGKEQKLTVFDCRSYIAALGNKIKGSGHENLDSYENVSLRFCDIGNIHDARNSINKLYNLLNGKETTKGCIYSALESTGWPEFIYLIIKSSISVASKIQDGINVLIHCSDGWDRCSQVTAFSQLLIDPYYRSLQGYMVLIEKDFLSFGHPFKQRNGYFTKELKENKSSPILLQFLDATHQLLVQFPMYFEFNMDFLLFIANNISTGKYGSFLYNNEYERDEAKIKTKTMSIWTEILGDVDKYRNPLYNPKSSEMYFLLPEFPNIKIRLWEEYFYQYNMINFNYSYDNYINKLSHVKKNKKDKKIVSNLQYIKKEVYDKTKIANDLSMCLKELIENNIINSSNLNVSEECLNVIRNMENSIKGISTINTTATATKQVVEEKKEIVKEVKLVKEEKEEEKKEADIKDKEKEKEKDKGEEKEKDKEKENAATTENPIKEETQIKEEEPKKEGSDS